MKKSLVILVLCGAATLLAQGPGPGRGRGPMGPRGKGGEGSEFGRTIAGAPYSGVEVVESTQTLANGNVISHKTETTIYRDSVGRVRPEVTVTPRPRPGQTTAEAPHTSITIHDPVARVTRELNSATKTGREIPMPRGRGGVGAGARPAASTTTPRAGRGTPGTVPANPNVVHETLAMTTINGVQATGTRVTRTVPAGQMGNTQPFQTVHESWISADLKVPVLVKDTDPRSRTTTRQLINITRSEPDPSLFQVSSDYKVTTAGRGRGFAR
jgi:hypothetical protein